MAEVAEVSEVEEMAEVASAQQVGVGMVDATLGCVLFYPSGVEVVAREVVEAKVDCGSFYF